MVLTVKYPPANVEAAGDLGSIPGLRRSSGGGHGNPLQYSCLENSMDRGAWRATVHGVKESDKTEATEHAPLELPRVCVCVCVCVCARARVCVN